MLAVLAVFVGIFGFINQDKLIDRFIERQARNTMQLEMLDNPEAFRLITVGTSAPVPSDRAQTCNVIIAVSYTHLRAHETSLHLVCRLLLEKK